MPSRCCIVICFNKQIENVVKSSLGTLETAYKILFTSVSMAQIWAFWKPSSKINSILKAAFSNIYVGDLSSLACFFQIAVTPSLSVRMSLWGNSRCPFPYDYGWGCPADHHLLTCLSPAPAPPLLQSPFHTAARANLWDVRGHRVVLLTLQGPTPHSETEPEHHRETQIVQCHLPQVLSPDVPLAHSLTSS